jgi:hypothetical protein
MVQSSTYKGLVMKKWTKAEALPILQQAYRDNVLAAQNGATECSYRGAFGPCVIGVLIDDQTASRWDTASLSGESLPLNIVYAQPETELAASVKAEMREMFADNLDWFSELQNSHDGWASNNEYDSSTTIGYKNELERLLELS